MELSALPCLNRSPSTAQLRFQSRLGSTSKPRTYLDVSLGLNPVSPTELRRRKWWVTSVWRESFRNTEVYTSWGVLSNFSFSSSFSLGVRLLRHTCSFIKKFTFSEIMKNPFSLPSKSPWPSRYRTDTHLRLFHYFFSLYVWAPKRLLTTVALSSSGRLLPGESCSQGTCSRLHTQIFNE